MGRKRDFTGQRFGHVVLLERIRKGFIHKSGKPETCYRVRCDCGNEKIVRAVYLYGMTQSCAECDFAKEKVRFRPFEALHNRVIRTALGRNIPCSLTYEDLLTFSYQPCHYCGAVINWTPYGKSTISRSINLDRKDNDFGYSLDNCVACCSRCNISKNAYFTYEEWLDIGKVIQTFPKREISTNRKILPPKKQSHIQEEY